MYCFCVLVNFLIAFSRISAEDLVSCSSDHTSLTGERWEVYFAPFPVLCASIRLSIFVVMPV